MILAKQSGLRPAVVGALLVAILSLTAIDPACAQAATPTDADSTLTPAEAQGALDVLQDAGKRGGRSSRFRPSPQLRPTQADATDSADGFGADLLSEASGKIGVLVA